MLRGELALAILQQPESASNVIRRTHRPPVVRIPLAPFPGRSSCSSQRRCGGAGSVKYRRPKPPIPPVVWPHSPTTTEQGLPRHESRGGKASLLSHSRRACLSCLFGLPLGSHFDPLRRGGVPDGSLTSSTAACM